MGTEKTSTFHIICAINDTTHTYDVTAAYFVEDASLILFKNTAHAVVFAVPTTYLLSIRRDDQ